MTNNFIIMGSANLSNGGGGGGSQDYNEQYNKPSINNYTLEGNLRLENDVIGVEGPLQIRSAGETGWGFAGMNSGTETHWGDTEYAAVTADDEAEGHEAFHLFDGSATYMSTGAQLPLNITYEIKSNDDAFHAGGVWVTGFHIQQSGTGKGVQTVVLQGSEDGTSFVDLATMENIPNDDGGYHADVPDLNWDDKGSWPKYKFIRLHIVSAYDSVVELAGFNVQAERDLMGKERTVIALNIDHQSICERDGYIYAESRINNWDLSKNPNLEGDLLETEGEPLYMHTQDHSGFGVPTMNSNTQTDWGDEHYCSITVSDEAEGHEAYHITRDDEGTYQSTGSYPIDITFEFKDNSWAGQTGGMWVQGGMIRTTDSGKGPQVVSIQGSDTGEEGSFVEILAITDIPNEATDYHFDNTNFNHDDFYSNPRYRFIRFHFTAGYDSILELAKIEIHGRALLPDGRQKTVIGMNIDWEYGGLGMTERGLAIMAPIGNVPVIHLTSGNYADRPDDFKQQPYLVITTDESTGVVTMYFAGKQLLQST